MGETLTATGATWPAPLEHLDRKWLRDGTPGASDPTRTLTSADRGAALSVRVTASQAGFASGTAASASTVVAAGNASATTFVPRVVGRAAAGRRLVAEPGSWTGTGWSFRHQWLRDGNPVAGADGAAYTPAAADIGRALSVRVTASQVGYDPGAATSAAATVGRYVSSTRASWVERTVRRGKPAKLRVVVAAEGLSAPTGRVRVVLCGHGVRKVSLGAGDAGRVTAKVAGLGPGRYRVRADYAGTKVVAPSRSATVVLRVR